MAVKPVVYDDSTKKHRPLGSGEKMDGLSASSIISADSGNLITTGSDGLAYATGSGIADPAADNLIEATPAGKLKVDIDRVVEWLDGHPSDAKDFAEAINVVSGDSGNLIREGTDGGAYASSAQLAPALADGVTVVSNPAGKLSVGDISGVAVVASRASAERALGDRFADFVNLKDFGAVGDGTTDDTEAWEAWLDAVEESGGLGYVPAGSYLVDGEAKNFPYGSIGHHEEGFTEIKPGFTDRFSDAIPIGQGHVFDSTRYISIDHVHADAGTEDASPETDGRHIYPTISINAKIDVPGNASDVDLDGKLVPTCHGIYLQHILTGGNAGNRLSSTCIVTNAINDAIGDNDCSGVAARAQKTAGAGIGDTAGLGGRVDDYSHQKGGCMGAELTCYNKAYGTPCPSDFDNVSTTRWCSPLHITGSGEGSPCTAAALIQGSRTSNTYWDGLQFSFSMFPSFGAQPANIVKNEIPQTDGSPSAEYPGATQSYESYSYDVDIEVDGVPQTETYTKWRLANTVAINMGSFSYSGGHPDTCIKMGKAQQHIWTPDQNLTVRAHGVDVRAAGNVYFRAAPKQYLDENDNPVYGQAGFEFCHRPLSSASYDERYDDSIVDASLYFNPETYAVDVHNFTSNTGLSFYKPGLSFSADDTAYFMPGKCTVLDANREPVLDGGGNIQIVTSKISLGHPNRKWENVYAETSSFSDSDERIKQDIADIPEAVLRAWGRVGFKQFRFREAVRLKGASARLHVGVIAQRVVEAFDAEGLDAFAYGLIGHDVLPAKAAVYRDYDVRHEAERDDDGNVIREAWTEHVHELAAEAEPACDVYSIRYEEALALECAYQRWRLEQIEARLGA